MRKIIAQCLFGLFVTACLFMVYPSAGVAGSWVEIKSNDETIFVTPGTWRITQWNPSSASVINVNTPLQKNGRIIGYAAETREPWRFILQQYVDAGWRNPSFYDQRLMAYYIPSDGSAHAVILTHVQYGGKDGKTVVGVMGTCRSPRNGNSYTVAFER